MFLTFSSFFKQFGCFFNFIYLLIDLKERGREGEEEKEREALIRCPTYLWIHRLVLVCALTRGSNLQLGIPGQRSDQRSCPVRTAFSSFSTLSAQPVLSPGRKVWCPSPMTDMGLNVLRDPPNGISCKGPHILDSLLAVFQTGPV